MPRPSCYFLFTLLHECMPLLQVLKRVLIVPAFSSLVVVVTDPTAAGL